MVGSLLIQCDEKSGEAILLHSMLPVSIRERHRAGETWAFVLDAQVCHLQYSARIPSSRLWPQMQIMTSASGIMAIRVLLDHGVREDRIIFVTFLVAPRGVHILNRVFPKVKIVTGSADSTLTPIWVPGHGDEEGRNVLCIEPGMGHIGAIACRDIALHRS